MDKKQERDREAPGDVMVLFGQRTRKSMWLFEKELRERTRKNETPGDVLVCLGNKQERKGGPR